MSQPERGARRPPESHTPDAAEPALDAPEKGLRRQESTQAEPDASSDGDGSWTNDPITQDPGEDRSVEAVIHREAARDHSV